jgi:uncharacterized repeat protein (TIGR03803 family)
MRSSLAVKEMKILKRSWASCLVLALALCAVASGQGPIQDRRELMRPPTAHDSFARAASHAYGGNSTAPARETGAKAQYSGTTLHSFTGYPTDGQWPNGGLVEDSKGYFYGTTETGGAYNFGTVYQIDAFGNYSILHNFNGKDGKFPASTLILDSKGYLYGTAYSGGPQELGTVFKLKANGKGNVTVMHSFSGAPDGRLPVGGLSMDLNGYLYGTTSLGGRYDFGTVFKLNSTGKDNETVLYSFSGAPDGAYPLATPIVDAAGYLHGVTTAGGTSGLGTVFQVDPAGAEIVLHSFAGGSDGIAPYYAALIRDSSGNLYGTTYNGGNGIYGTAFKVTPTGNESILYYFCWVQGSVSSCGDGANPLGGLTKGADGLLYGTTEWGGWYYGTIFKLDPSIDTESVLWEFTDYIIYTDGALPHGPLIQDKSGAFYGTTYGGGRTGWEYSTGFGSVFTFTP